MMTQTPATNSRFEFVTLAAARARQLLRGCTPRVEPSHKPARSAQREIEAGVVVREVRQAQEPPQA